MVRKNRGPKEEEDEPVYGDAYTYQEEEEKADHALSRKKGGIEGVTLPIGGRVRIADVVTGGKKGGVSGHSWIDFVKGVREELGCSYKDALKEASVRWRKKGYNI